MVFRDPRQVSLAPVETKNRQSDSQRRGNHFFPTLWEQDGCEVTSQLRYGAVEGLNLYEVLRACANWSPLTIIVPDTLLLSICYLHFYVRLWAVVSLLSDDWGRLTTSFATLVGGDRVLPKHRVSGGWHGVSNRDSWTRKWGNYMHVGGSGRGQGVGTHGNWATFQRLKGDKFRQWWPFTR